MNDKDALLTLLLLGGLALGGYWLIQKSRVSAPEPEPQPTPEPMPTPNLGSDVVNPSPFGLSVGDPCKRFPSLCKFW
jgi:hypothetical protein